VTEPGVPIVLCIDVEPDARLVDRDRPTDWHGFELFLAELPRTRDRLAAATGTAPRFTWFLRMDAQVAETWGSPGWVVDRYGEELSALERAGDELGLHPHVWRWHEGARSWFVEHEDRAWIEGNTRMALDAFERSLGRPCRSHRGGDRFVSADMLSLMVPRGMRVDLTIEPGLPPAGPLDVGEFSRGTTPDYRDSPAEPYHPRSAEDLLVPGGGEPLMVPLFSTLADDGCTRAPLYLWVEPDAFAEALDGELAAGAPPALAFAVRSDVPMAHQWPWVLTNLELLGRHPEVRGHFVTASEAASALSDRPASSRKTA
jgi:hypothetical protein